LGGAERPGSGSGSEVHSRFCAGMLNLRRAGERSRRCAPSKIAVLDVEFPEPEPDPDPVPGRSEFPVHVCAEHAREAGRLAIGFQSPLVKPYHGSVRDNQE
ncbi:MAG: hypothetical protein ACSLFQ_16030, partial [Thermoanaerobaculia bacterium]